MRVSTFYSHQLGANAIIEQQANSHQTQLQLSSGKRILTPADDPVASAISISMDQTIAQVDQYDKNIQAAKNRLKQEESVLAGATNILQRVRELTVRGLNDTLSPAERQGVAAEIYELKEQILAMANTRDGSGDFLFSGNKSQTEPFTESPPGTFNWQGDQGQRFIEIGVGRQVATDNSGFEVFYKIPDGAGGFQSVFQTVLDTADNMNTDAPQQTDLVKLDEALQNILTVRSSVGSRLNAIDSQESVNSSQKLDTQVALSELRDLDYAEAVSRLNIQLAGLQAAQQSYVKVQGLSLFDFI